MKNKSDSNLLNILTTQTTSDSMILFIHGVGGRAEQWKYQIDFFKNNYHTITPDLPGHGNSSPLAAGYHYQELMNALLEIFHKNKKKNNILVGHSYGAVLALGLANELKMEINKLILINSIVPEPPKLIFFSKIPDCLLEYLRPVFSYLFIRASYAKTTSKQIILEEKKISDKNPMNIIKKIIMGMEGITNISFENLHVPTLVIHGIQDGITSLKKLKSYFVKLPNVQFAEIEEASHLSFIEKPETVNQRIKEFLE